MSRWTMGDEPATMAKPGSSVTRWCEWTHGSRQCAGMSANRAWHGSSRLRLDPVALPISAAVGPAVRPPGVGRASARLRLSLHLSNELTCDLSAYSCLCSWQHQYTIRFHQAPGSRCRPSADGVPRAGRRQARRRSVCGHPRNTRARYDPRRRPPGDIARVSTPPPPEPGG